MGVKRAETYRDASAGASVKEVCVCVCRVCALEVCMEALTLSLTHIYTFYAHIIFKGGEDEKV